MRFFEIILLVAITVLPFVWKPLAMRVAPKFIILGLLSAVVLQLVVEGYRWQMLPAYILAVILAIRIGTADASKSFKFSFLTVLRFVLFPGEYKKWPSFVRINIPYSGRWSLGNHLSTLQ